MSELVRFRSTQMLNFRAIMNVDRPDDLPEKFGPWEKLDEISWETVGRMKLNAERVTAKFEDMGYFLYRLGPAADEAAKAAAAPEGAKPPANKPRARKH